MSDPTCMADLLGDTLVIDGGDSVKTADLCAGKTVGLYFSAHWCGPCRNFTPRLAEVYTDCKLAGKPLEVIFVSSDNSEAEFKEYHGSMPWHALPFADRERKAQLSKRFKVQGIPSLVILDGDTAKTLNGEARGAVGNGGAEAFPWEPPTFKSAVSGKKLVRCGGGDSTTFEELEKSGKHVFLYFSAHWCPPCKKFTPELVKFYEAHAKSKNFEIVFISSDKSQGEFDEYAADMPWLALDYSERKAKEDVSEVFGVQGIPTLVLLKPDLTVLNAEARAKVDKEPDAATFPEGWAPPLVPEVEDATDKLNGETCLLVLCEEAGMKQDSISAALEAVAKTTEDVHCMIATEAGSGVVGQIRKLAKMPPRAKQGEVTVLLLTLSDGLIFKRGGGKDFEVTEEGLRALLSDWEAGKADDCKIDLKDE